jgi:hypothetical protein
MTNHTFVRTILGWFYAGTTMMLFKTIGLHRHLDLLLHLSLTVMLLPLVNILVNFITKLRIIDHACL